MLHGRGSFTDNERHLLRIRMNKFSYSMVRCILGQKVAKIG